MATSDTLLLVFVAILALVPSSLPAKKASNLMVEVDDIKEFKKLIRTKTNVLVVFGKTMKDVNKQIKMYSEVAEKMKGKATIATVDCSEAKKMCKKLKVSPSPLELKHYKDGDFNKNYDRRDAVKSMVNFLLDPTGDIPWEEDPTAEDVVHIDTPQGLNKLLSKEKRGILVMFYAPWCGFCKRLKPDYAAAATEVKNKHVLCGIDVDKPEMMSVRMEYNITGFPTIYYFQQGKKMQYGGENNKEGIVSWLKDPHPPKEKAKEAEWADEESEVAHLTDANFDQYLKDHPSVLVMFYAPWCGHCKKMKPEYTDAAQKLQDENVEGILAAVDATKERKVAEQFKIQGFPTVKYFKNGEFAFDYNERTADKLVDFMKDPKEPPPPPPPEPEWSEQENDVNFLTEENFKTFLKKKKHTLIMFYAPWCGHCKAAKPHFTNAAAKFKDDSKVAFAAVDCTQHSSVCTAHDVTGYPTFKYVNYGKNEQQYSGGREEADFVNFMNDPLNPLASAPPAAPPAEDDWVGIAGSEEITHLLDTTFDEYMKTHDSVLVMFYAPWCGHCKAMKPAYGEAARQLKDMNINGNLATVDATVERTLQSRFDIRGFPTLKYFKNGEFAFDYQLGRSTTDLITFMQDPKAPPPPPPKEPEWSEEPSEVNHLESNTFDGFIKEHKSVLVMFYAPWCGHCKKMKPAYVEAAAFLHSEVPDTKLAAVDATKHVELAAEYGIKGYPTLKYFENGKEQFKYAGGRSAEDLIEFMKNPVEAPPKPKAPAPEPKWSDVPSNINHLNQDNYNTFLQEKSNVLVMYYAPWCGHCKQAKPAYQEVADTLKASTDTFLAAIDCTSTGDICTSENIPGFPTFKYFKNGKFVQEYEGNRSKEDIIKFLNDMKSEKKDEL